MKIGDIWISKGFSLADDGTKIYILIKLIDKVENNLERYSKIVNSLRHPIDETWVVSESSTTMDEICLMQTLQLLDESHNLNKTRWNISFDNNVDILGSIWFYTSKQIYDNFVPLRRNII